MENQIRTAHHARKSTPVAYVAPNETNGKPTLRVIGADSPMKVVENYLMPVTAFDQPLH